MQCTVIHYNIECSNILEYTKLHFAALHCIRLGLHCTRDMGTTRLAVCSVVGTAVCTTYYSLLTTQFNGMQAAPNGQQRI